MRRGRATLVLVFAVAAFARAEAQDLFAGRPAFAPAEGVVRVPARCDDLAGQLAGLPDPESRIDLAVTGALTLVQTDGALWYLAVCSSPGIRVMCVTYEGNAMRAGDRVVLRGGYNRQDPTHVVLDPCLASRVRE